MKVIQIIYGNRCYYIRLFLVLFKDGLSNNVKTKTKLLLQERFLRVIRFDRIKEGVRTKCVVTCLSQGLVVFLWINIVQVGLRDGKKIFNVLLYVRYSGIL